MTDDAVATAEVSPIARTLIPPSAERPPPSHLDSAWYKVWSAYVPTLNSPPGIRRTAYTPARYFLDAVVLLGASQTETQSAAPSEAFRRITRALGIAEGTTPGTLENGFALTIPEEETIRAFCASYDQFLSDLAQVGLTQQLLTKARESHSPEAHELSLNIARLNQTLAQFLYIIGPLPETDDMYKPMSEFMQLLYEVSFRTPAAGFLRNALNGARAQAALMNLFESEHLKLNDKASGEPRFLVIVPELEDEGRWRKELEATDLVDIDFIVVDRASGKIILVDSKGKYDESQETPVITKRTYDKGRHKGALDLAIDVIANADSLTDITTSADPLLVSISLPTRDTYLGLGNIRTQYEENFATILGSELTKLVEKS